MDFLDHENHSSTVELSKSRSKDQKRRDRELRAESDFFTDAATHGLLAAGSHQSYDVPEQLNHYVTSRRTPNTTTTSKAPRKRHERPVGTADTKSPLQSRSFSLPRHGGRDEAHSRNSSYQMTSSLRGVELGDRSISEDNTEHVTSTDLSMGALLATGVFDFPGLPSKPASVMPSRDLPSGITAGQLQNKGGLGSQLAEEPTKPVYQDKGIMANPSVDSLQGLGSANPSVAYGIDNMSFDYTNQVSERGLGHAPETEVESDMHGQPYQNAQGVGRESGTRRTMTPGTQEADAQAISHISHTHQVPDNTEPRTNVLVFEDAKGRTPIDGTETATGRPWECANQQLVDGANPYFPFPGNRPSVQPLTYGMLQPQPFHQSSTSSETIQHQRPITTPVLGWPGEGRRCESRQTPRPRWVQPSEPLDEHLHETMSDFIERIENEVLGRPELYPHVGQDVEYPRVDDCAHTDSSYVYSTRYGLEHQTDPPLARTNAEPQFQSRSVWDQAQNSEDLEMAAFWRPNRFL